ncbi:MAG: aspartate/glutamate racemase family protein [Acidobacteriota bacterium]
MPRVEPLGGEVDWPRDEGAIGVVGVAPWATLDFCRALYSEVEATKDWHYPRVLLDINTKIPSRGRHLQLGERDPSPDLAATLEELATQGATVAVVACNTAHILFERWGEKSPIPVLHIVEETVGAARAAGARRVAALGSGSMADHDLYGRALRAAGLEAVALDAAEQCWVGEAIEAVKVSGASALGGLENLSALLERLRRAGVDTVLGGCTELSGLRGPCEKGGGLRFIDSNRSLALAALRRINLPPKLLAG